MNTEILRKIGLTEGEIRVYEALVSLGKSSTGAIMDKSGISSSKVYLILEKLIQKGLVSFVIENNVRKFQVANPKNILDYLSRQQNELEKIKTDSEIFIQELAKIIGKHEEESAQIYKGHAGLRAAFNNITDELGKGEEFLFFSPSEEELTDPKVILFFKNLHLKRIEKGIKAKGVADITLKELFQKELLKQKDYTVRFSALTLPSAVSIGKNRILLNSWGEEPIGFEIVSRRVAEKYREFFYSLWNRI